MEYFFTIFNQRLKALPTGFIREPFGKGAWKNRLLGIKGARGVGKTTLLLQYAKLNLPLDDRSLYVSLNDIYFTSHRLSDLVSDFVKTGAVTCCWMRCTVMPTGASR